MLTLYPTKNAAVCRHTASKQCKKIIKKLSPSSKPQEILTKKIVCSFGLVEQDYCFRRGKRQGASESRSYFLLKLCCVCMSEKESFKMVKSLSTDCNTFGKEKKAKI